MEQKRDGLGGGGGGEDDDGGVGFGESSGMEYGVSCNRKNAFLSSLFLLLVQEIGMTLLYKIVGFA